MSEESGLRPRPLEPLHIDPAYSLVREIATSLTLEDWRRCARHFAAARPLEFPAPAGMVVLEDERRHLRGLFAYCVLPSLNHGGMLTLDCLAIPELVCRWQIAENLLKSAEHCARHFECHTVCARLERANAWLGELFRQMGYVEEGPAYRHRLLRLAAANVP